jgi:hypothetical protein
MALARLIFVLPLALAAVFVPAAEARVGSADCGCSASGIPVASDPDWSTTKRIVYVQVLRGVTDI